MLILVFAKRFDDNTELLGLVIKFECIILHQDIKFGEELVPRDLLHNIMDNRQQVLFAFAAFVERAEFRDLHDLAIFWQQ